MSSPARRAEADLVACVQASVAALIPVDGRQRRSQRGVLAALAALPRPFDEAADPTHVTGSGVVIGRRGVLLHRHKRLNRWLQPGGHLEPGEPPWDAAAREAAEETGLDVVAAGWRRPGRPPALLHVDLHAGGRGHTHLDLRYLLRVRGDDEPRPPAGESQQVRWFTWDEAIVVADAGLRGLLGHLRPPQAAD